MSNSVLIHPETRINIVTILQRLINQTIQLATDTTANLQDRIINLFYGIYNVLSGAQVEAYQMLEDLELGVNKTLQLYTTTSTCVAERIGHITNITKTARDNINNNCFKSARDTVGSLRVDVQQYVESITFQIGEINSIINKCSSIGENSYDAAVCVINHVRFFNLMKM